MTQNKPVKVFKCKSITASVFANLVKANGGEFTMHKVSLQRTYREGEEFKHVSSFGRDDIPVARMLLEDAYRFIHEREAEQKKAEAPE